MMTNLSLDYKKERAVVKPLLDRAILIKKSVRQIRRI